MAPPDRRDGGGPQAVRAAGNRDPPHLSNSNSNDNDNNSSSNNNEINIFNNPGKIVIVS